MHRVKVLQYLEKVTTGIETGVPLMPKLAYPICKEFLGLLPKPRYHTLHASSPDMNHTAFEGFLGQYRGVKIAC
jgi:hypothetical protein